MTATTLPAVAPTSHVDAYRCTGTSPGRTGQTLIRLDLDCGEALDVRVGYELQGPANAPPIVVLGGISAGRHLAPTTSSPGWWPGVVGPGAALDPGRHRLLGMDYVGGPAAGLRGEQSPAGGSTSTRHPITSGDQARALAAVLDDLGLGRVTLVGASYGGMVGLAFADLYPRRVRHLVCLCAAHRTHPMATALRAIQRGTVRLAQEAGRPRAGLSLGRALAMTTYRSAAEFDARFDWRPLEDSTSPRFPVEEYLEERGRAFAERFDPDAFVTLSESIDLHAVDPARITAPTTLVSVDSDVLVPPWLVDELAAASPGVGRHVTLSSIFGHDAFLKEVGLVSDVIRSALRLEGAAR